MNTHQELTADESCSQCSPPFLHCKPHSKLIAWKALCHLSPAWCRAIISLVSQSSKFHLCTFQFYLTRGSAWAGDREKTQEWCRQQPDLLGSAGIISSRQQSLLTQGAGQVPQGSSRQGGGPGAAMINGLSATEEEKVHLQFWQCVAPGQPKPTFG